MAPGTFDLTALSELFTLLRKQGVVHFAQNGLSVTFGPAVDAAQPEIPAQKRRLPPALGDMNPDFLDPALGFEVVVK